MPATAEDAHDLLISSVLCDDPVLYIDDRWLYEREAVLSSPRERPLSEEGPVVRRPGSDITLVGAGYSAYLCEQAAERLAESGVNAEVVDLRVINPLEASVVLESVARTGRLCVVDGSWRTAGLAGEVLALVAENLVPGTLHSRPVRVVLPDAPAPTSKALEEIYYPDADTVVQAVNLVLGSEQ